MKPVWWNKKSCCVVLERGDTFFCLYERPQHHEHVYPTLAHMADVAYSKWAHSITSDHIQHSQYLDGPTIWNVSLQLTTEKKRHYWLTLHQFILRVESAANHTLKTNSTRKCATLIAPRSIQRERSIMKYKRRIIHAWYIAFKMQLLSSRAGAKMRLKCHLVKCHPNTCRSSCIQNLPIKS